MTQTGKKRRIASRVVENEDSKAVIGIGTKTSNISGRTRELRPDLHFSFVHVPRGYGFTGPAPDYKFVSVEEVRKGLEKVKAFGLYI